jgi:hypothetical protein
LELSFLLELQVRTCTVHLFKCALLYARLPATLPFLPLVVLMLEAACVERRTCSELAWS